MLFGNLQLPEVESVRCFTVRQPRPSQLRGTLEREFPPVSELLISFASTKLDSMVLGTQELREGEVCEMGIRISDSAERPFCPPSEPGSGPHNLESLKQEMLHSLFRARPMGGASIEICDIGKRCGQARSMAFERFVFVHGCVGSTPRTNVVSLMWLV